MEIKFWLNSTVSSLETPVVAVLAPAIVPRLSSAIIDAFVALLSCASLMMRIGKMVRSQFRVCVTGIVDMMSGARYPREVGEWCEK